MPGVAGWQPMQLQGSTRPPAPVKHTANSPAAPVPLAIRSRLAAHTRHGPCRRRGAVPPPSRPGDAASHNMKKGIPCTGASSL